VFYQPVPRAHNFLTFVMPRSSKQHDAEALDAKSRVAMPNIAMPNIVMPNVVMPSITILLIMQAV
jgi:hypothetical protein